MLHFDGGSHLLDSCSSLPAFGRVVRHCPSRRQGRKFKPVIGHSHVSSHIGYPIATRAGEKRLKIIKIDFKETGFYIT